MRKLLALATLLLVPLSAHAALILTFGQTTDTQAITATANGAGTATTLVATNEPISVTQILGGSATSALFNLNLSSVGPATPLGGGGTQHFAGSFSITSGATNLLSGTFSDILLGVGPSGVLAVGSPPDVLNLTSDVITSLLPPSAVALSFANLTPAFSIDNTTTGSFTSSVSGTFSASPVPEPASLALLGVGLLGLTLVRRRA